MPTVVIAEERAPQAETIAAIASGLDAYNKRRAGDARAAALWLIARDDAGRLVGGVKAETFWNWCSIAWLWVAERARGRRLGSALLLRTEAAAIARGCTGISLSTFSFQAPDFYRSHGYREFGRLDGCPAGHARIWFMKELRPASAVAYPGGAPADTPEGPAPPTSKMRLRLPTAPVAARRTTR